MDFVPAVAYHFCLALPAVFTQPEDHLLAKPCRETLEGEEGKSARVTFLRRISCSIGVVVVVVGISAELDGNGLESAAGTSSYKSQPTIIAMTTI